jgi:hypothetical protein
MRITSGGNVGIGTSSPAYPLDIQATSGALGISLRGRAADNISLITFFNNAANTQLAKFTAASTYFSTDVGGSERMRIASGGTVGINTTSTSAQLNISSTGTVLEAIGSGTGNTTFVLKNTAATFNNSLFYGVTTNTGSGFRLLDLRSNNGTSEQFYVRGDGVIYAQNTTIQSLSDVRTKENIVNSQDGLNIISALRPVRFDFKKGFGNDRKNQLGFIAQEVEAVFPDAVDIWKESEEVGNPYKSMGASALIPVLVKAIQELENKIEQLKK